MVIVMKAMCRDHDGVLCWALEILSSNVTGVGIISLFSLESLAWQEKYPDEVKVSQWFWIGHCHRVMRI